MKVRKWLTIATLAALSAAAEMSLSADWQPWEVTKNNMTTAKHRHDDPIELNPLVQGVRFFQRYISVVDSPRCPMYPTCSAYSLQAMDKHGPLLGMFMTVDRILHETNPLEQTIPLEGYERERFYDPVSNNDFWLNN